MIEVTFPFQALWRQVTWRPVGLTHDPQESLSGELTPVPSFGGRWECDAEIIAHTEAQVLAWDAFVGQMQGGLGVTVVPAWQRFPAKGLDGKVSKAQWDRTAPLEGGTWEHFGFSTEPSIYATAASAVSLRGTQMRVTNTKTTGLRPGHRFSVADRLYRVLRHWEDETGPVIQFWPPAREAIALGDTLDLDRPGCRMRLAAGGEPAMAPSPLDSMTVRFVEAR